ncbi:hypothetical protein KL905_002786 [Ogataea polymorpha]|uniref:Required for respiratory growth protein 9, mitochondrial n=1 Tax=Ogataea polymorpha TaxID=460523 RepID=A0A1B7SQB7_9ASCO|nr:uncharacterized protein OGAPODRAFT_92120 [Ogataea polymorpha]KAG7893207.1 hypothetical protein KL908_002940 [Ogataea polymorpha]KAG7900644.1 hypothetical protein KL935_002577 [Ogataea polymorpha]KAG7905043.1 hypothetical protein KL907_003259 [Ogataea polymorpha]KAG7907837.1 hypothetical protein KL906_003254 [Ogataea polymorpha]KAG7916421.1 hypothetical protein KL927_003060 [Ogataea polymorpha]
MFLRRFSSFVAPLKRTDKWELPDLEKLPGGFRGKVYNRRDWKEHIARNTDIYAKEEAEKPKPKVKLPPPGWRKDKSLPLYMRQKYALKEKAAQMDLTKTKKLSRQAIEGIRVLHSKYPDELPSHKLAEFFQVPVVAVAKILKSKWSPKPHERAAKEKKWEERGKELRRKIFLENQLEKFFEAKEQELGLELPYFFKQELRDFANLHGFNDLEDQFYHLNEMRVKREKEAPALKLEHDI